jgi:hypothetical protein
METLQKAQSEFASQFINQGVELQKKQFILFTNLFQNQVEFGKYLFSSVITVINDNTSSNDENKKEIPLSNAEQLYNLLISKL